VRILNYGSMNIDRVYRVTEIVSRKETISTTDYVELIGGKGLNQSIALTLAGVPVYHAGKLGEDGRFLKEYLAEKGVNTDFVLSSSNVSGHAVIQVDQNGENAIIVHGGSNHEITEKDIDLVLENFDKDDWLLIQNEISNLDYLINRAYAKGLKIHLNPSPITDTLLKSSLNKISTFILNEVEGFRLTGKTEIENILSDLKLRYPIAEFVLTLGENGSVYYSGTKKYFQKSFKVEALDPTGAGDTFTGYFLACRFRGMSVEESMNYASAASALSVTKLGASNSIPTFSEVQHWIG